MKSLRILVLTIILTMLVLTACQAKPVVDTKEPLDNSVKDSTEVLEKSTGIIYLYGEEHSVDKILEKELELWGKYYTNDYMRHLFVELPYYTAEFLNIWMKSDNDDIFEEVHRDSMGTQSYTDSVKKFYMTIKSQYPETIFHGTDVGHQHATTGQRYLQYLKDNNLENSEQYKLTQQTIGQGTTYYKRIDHEYRENTMVTNFIREFDKLKDKNVMGIYGAAHTEFGAKDYMTSSVFNMATQLKERYGDKIYSEDLSSMAKDIEPLRVDIIAINDKDYEASYFGKYNMTGIKDYASREIWRLENAYEDFKDLERNGNVLPNDNYPMKIEKGQVFFIKYVKTDGSEETGYYLFDGYVWNGRETTVEFVIK